MGMCNELVREAKANLAAASLSIFIVKFTPVIYGHALRITHFTQQIYILLKWTETRQGAYQKQLGVFSKINSAFFSLFNLY